ncbi:MAG: hypothetical protein ACP5NX_01080 [Candidatus Bilamarchaeaceae archaeon]
MKTNRINREHLNSLLLKRQELFGRRGKTIGDVLVDIADQTEKMERITGALLVVDHFRYQIGKLEGGRPYFGPDVDTSDTYFLFAGPELPRALPPGADPKDYILTRSFDGEHMVYVKKAKKPKAEPDFVYDISIGEYTIRTVREIGQPLAEMFKSQFVSYIRAQLFGRVKESKPEYKRSHLYGHPDRTDFERCAKELDIRSIPAPAHFLLKLRDNPEHLYWLLASSNVSKERVIGAVEGLSSEDVSAMFSLVDWLTNSNTGPEYLLSILDPSYSPLKHPSDREVLIPIIDSDGGWCFVDRKHADKFLNESL